MNLRLPKRTQQIDDQREKLLGYDSEGGPIWTTKNAHVLTGDEKHELASKLHDKQRYAAIQRNVKSILEGASKFLEASVLATAPEAVFANYVQGDGELFADWFKQSGYGFKQDGLRSVLLRHGQEQGSICAKVDEMLKEDVLTALKFEHVMAGGGM